MYMLTNMNMYMCTFQSPIMSILAGRHPQFVERCRNATPDDLRCYIIKIQTYILIYIYKYTYIYTHIYIYI